MQHHTFRINFLHSVNPIQFCLLRILATMPLSDHHFYHHHVHYQVPLLSFYRLKTLIIFTLH